MNVHDQDDRRGLWKVINEFVTGAELQWVDTFQSAARNSASWPDVIQRVAWRRRVSVAPRNSDTVMVPRPRRRGAAGVSRIGETQTDHRHFVKMERPFERYRRDRRLFVVMRPPSRY